MNVTNKHNLPKTLLNAIERDPYSMGDARMSVTGLLRPPRITWLSKKHSHSMTSDVTDHIWSLMGRAVHKILEEGGDEEHLAEERLFIDVLGWRVSGAVDLQRLGNNRVRITDYKNCSAYAVMHEKPEWVQQLNFYAHLIRVAKGWDVEALSICAFIRDWSRHKVSDNNEYPAAPAVMLGLPVWSPEEAAAFVEGRVRLHQEAIASTDMGDEAPLCSDEERWMRRESWAVKKPENKKPLKVFTDREKAEAFLKSKGDGYISEHRKGEPIRCTGDYCHVSAWCSQYAEWQKQEGVK